MVQANALVLTFKKKICVLFLKKSFGTKTRSLAVVSPTPDYHLWSFTLQVADFFRVAT